MENYLQAIIQFDFSRYPVGAFYIMVFIGVSVWGQMLFKRWMGTESIELCHEVGGYYMAVVGSLYAVVLGLVIYDAISNYQSASLCVKNEAKALLAVYSMADQFTDNGTTDIKALTSRYVEEVVNNEWPLMDQHGYSQKARMTMWLLLDVVKKIEPRNENQKALLPILMSEAITTWSERRERLDKVDMGIPGVEWFVLLTGAVVTIIFTYFFTISVSKAQLLMTAMISFLVAINLYLVMLFGEPFSGDLKIDTTAFDILTDYIQSHLALEDAGIPNAIEPLSRLDDGGGHFPD